MKGAFWQFLAEFFQIPLRETPLALIGLILIAFGLLVAVLNWGLLRAQQNLMRQNINRNISMVFLLGFALPIGCLLIAPLRIHALWVWIFDPASLWLVGSSPAMFREWLSERNLKND